MINYHPLYKTLKVNKAIRWLDQLPTQIEQAFDFKSHGSAKSWLENVQNLPEFSSAECVFNQSAIKIGASSDLNTKDKQSLIDLLKTFHPWRKGPYDLFGIHIDTEWRSDWKWDRLEPFISPLNDRLVLDVGCGNGYHCWRMYGVGARMVIGVDPLLLNVIQFQAIRKMAGEHPVYVLPSGLENIPEGSKIFDTVFSMGVLYHRRSPIDHLMELKNRIKSGGELVLETLVIDGKDGQVLVPEGRYAKMRNVWFLPSCDTLLGWLKRCGFQNSRVIDVNQTSIEEQRTTEWMEFNSLSSFLDPQNTDLTIEGLPAPKRAIIVANAA